MSMTFLNLQNEVKRRATRDQGGTQFDTATKRAINAALLRISREALWRPLRRKSYLSTVTSYTTGTATVTSASTTVTIASASLVDDGVEVGRRMKISGDSTYFTIRQITGNTGLVLDQAYGGTSGVAGTYEIYPQEEYTLPVQCGHRMFLWHEEYGYPFLMSYIPEQQFLHTGRDIVEKNVPERYRMWGEDMVKKQMLTSGTISVFSSDSGDTNQAVTIFGISSLYPDSETYALNGASVVTGTTTFSSLERVVKNGSTNGRITIADGANTANVYAVIPAGGANQGIIYKKIQINPLPNTAFDINVYYYKEPFILVDDGDVHELGPDFDEAIILLATTKIQAETSQAEAASFYKMYSDELVTLRRTNADKPDWIPTMKRPYPGRSDSVGNSILQYRQLGGSFGPRAH